MNLYFCSHCGNVVTKLTDSGVPLICCGQPMTLLEPGSTDGAVEKHIPVVQQGNRWIILNIGSSPHPMTEAHSILWVLLETEHGFYLRHLSPGSDPQADFLLPCGESPIAAYAYGNLHGLWKTTAFSRTDTPC